jgi:Carboxypeptidase regulatory-like domain
MRCSLPFFGDLGGTIHDVNRCEQSWTRPRRLTMLRGTFVAMKKPVPVFFASLSLSRVLMVVGVWEHVPARWLDGRRARTRFPGRLFILIWMWALVPLALAPTPLIGRTVTASMIGNPTLKSGGQEVGGNSQYEQNQPRQPNDSRDPSTSPQKGNTEPQLGSIVGTVIDVNGDPVSGATVILQGPGLSDQRTVGTNDNGFFEIHDVEPGIPYRVTISATGFADWTSSVVVLTPDQYEIVTDIKLRIREVRTTVTVSPKSSEEIATEQVKIQEMQRGFGIVPNFLAVYYPNPEPLTRKLKFDLAFKFVRDPITVAGAGVVAGAEQAAGTPDYADGIKGFAQRFGASYANQFTNTMIGDAILPSLLHQDPRYFYQGSGTTKSRVLHAISNIVITRGDNGHPQPNYSLLGGDLASAAISNAYYPKSNRGVGLVFQNFAINTAVHMSGRLLQEFVYRPSNRASQPQGPFHALRKRSKQ